MVSAVRQGHPTHNALQDLISLSSCNTLNHLDIPIVNSSALNSGCWGTQVYLQVGQKGQPQDLSSRFSGMMFKVLQAAYLASPTASQVAATTARLSCQAPDTSYWRPVSLPLPLPLALPPFFMAGKSMLLHHDGTVWRQLCKG